MLPSKLKALNGLSTDASSDDLSSAPVKITKEALETKAELQYSQALQYLSKDKLDEAEKQLSQLLQSEIIISLSTLFKTDTSRCLLDHLKYCCLTNLGNILFKKSKYPEALMHYQEALIMDSSDLNLWYRIGLTHSKLYQIDSAISSFLQGIKCNPNHWPTLDKLISLLYATNEYVCCLHYISIALNLDSNYLKGHFIKDIIFKKFPSLITYFKSYCSKSGLDIKCIEIIDLDVQQKVLNEIKNIKNNYHTLCPELKSINIEHKPILFAKHIIHLKSWVFLGKRLLKIYDNMFENYEHSFLYESINFEFNCELSNQNTTENYITVDENDSDDDFENQSIKLDVVPSTKRKKNISSLADQLKLSRRSTRNKANLKSNESSLLKSVWNMMPQHLLLNKDNSDNINSIKWTDDSLDTMDLYRLYEFSDMLNDDGHIENCLKNSITDEERQKLINDENYFGSNNEINDLKTFLHLNNNTSISNLLEIYLIEIAKKWSILWPTPLVQIYLDIFKRVWIHTKKHLTFIPRSNMINMNEIKLEKIQNDILCILTYGEVLCDHYFQSKISQKPLEGSIIGGEFCTLWIGNIKDALSSLDLKDDTMITFRFLWLKVLLNLQYKESSLICDLLDTLLNSISNLDDYEIILPNLEYFYRINKRITEKLIFTLKRNNLLNTVKNLYESKSYLSVVNILKETLKQQNYTGMEIPNYPIMTRYNQYIYMLNSLLELKNYHELFRWCEPCLNEAILQYRKSLIEDSVVNQKTNQTEFINNIFYAMLESIQIEGLNVFENLSHIYKTRLIQSVINLLSYLIETPDGNSEIDVVSPWLLIYNLLKYEESNTNTLKSCETDCIPQSLAFLILSHEYLGKKSWCCFQDGVLLFLTLTEIEPYIHSDFYLKTLVQEVDQIFYCLYKHQIKRNRPRYIQEHNSMGLALTWSRGKQLVHFYQPTELPSFDGKTFTLNSDIETMFKTVISLIPEEMKPNRLIDNLMAYITGETDEIPVNDNPLPIDVKDIYYLMADYYFKNKTWGKAIKYYLFDICYNLNRIDSWAGLALAGGSQLEIKLNSCESIKNENEIIKKAHITGQCYKQSLKISPGNTLLLIEYGTLAYSIHSYCSRLLKQETSNMNLQMFGQLENVKENMIKTAKECFESANTVCNNDCESQDERWLYYYILGKIAEKSDDGSILFIELYLKAIQFLDSYNAKFPEHIIYTDPQYYSIEVLEIYYRIHAGVLKLLEKPDNQLFNKKFYEQIKLRLDYVCNMSLIVNKKKETKDQSGVQIILCSDQVKDKIIEDGVDNTKIVSNSNLLCDQNDTTTDISIIPDKQIKLNNDLTVQEITDLRWELIQRCLVALQNCMKKFPQHYKSYYRLAYFYFRSPFHKDYDKFRELMFGDRGLFVSKKHNNFFHGIWRIPISEIDRPGSFAYHMSRSVHLLLDFLKETGDHRMLLDLAIQLKYTPDLDKKYLRDNEREGISKEALFLSIQILKSQYVNTVNHSKNVLLLIQVYKCYKRVLKCWHLKDHNLSKLLLLIYQNILKTKDNISMDIIIKYCQKLQMEEKELNKNNDDIMLSTPLPIETKVQDPNMMYALPLNKLIASQSISSALDTAYIQSQAICPISLETTNYARSVQKKWKKMKLAFKDCDIINNKQKTEKIREASDRTDNQYCQTVKQHKKLRLKTDKTSIIPSNKINESVHNSDSAIEIIKLPSSNNIAYNKYNKIYSSSKHNEILSSHSKASAIKQNPDCAIIANKTICSRNLKTVCINLDSGAEKARSKPSVLQNNDRDRKMTAPVILNSGIILPGLSITPIVHPNHQANEPSTSHQVHRNVPTKSKSFNFERLANILNITNTD